MKLKLTLPASSSYSQHELIRVSVQSFVLVSVTAFLSPYCFPKKHCFVRFSYFYFHCALFQFLLCFACFRSVCLTSQGHRTVQGFDRSYLKGKNKTF